MTETTDGSSSPRDNRTGTYLRAAVSLALLGVIAYRTDWWTLVENVRKLSLGTVGLALAINLGAHAFLAFRWHLALAMLRVKAPFRTVLRCYWLGLFFNLFLPSSIGGDVARSYYLYRARRQPQLAGASSLLDRWAGLLALLTMASVAAIFLPASSDLGFLRGAMVAALGGFALASLVLMGRASRRFRSLGRDRLRALGRGRLRPLSLALRSVSTSLRLVPRRLDLLLGAVLCTFLYYAALTLTHALLARDLGLPAPLYVLAIYVPLMAILSMVPITVNGIGLREALYIGLFSAVGWPQEAALTLSWVIFSSVLLAGVPGAFLQAGERPKAQGTLPGEGAGVGLRSEP